MIDLIWFDLFEIWHLAKQFSIPEHTKLQHTIQVYTCNINAYNIATIGIQLTTIETWLSESPLSEPSVILMLFWILKYQEIIEFSAKPSYKWNTCMIFRLVRLIIS